MANEEPEFHRLGGEIVAVSVDSPGRNEALRQRWSLPFPILSDPGGAELLVPLNAWNPDERGGIAWPLVVLFDPDGHEVFRYRSRDFADRPSDDDLIHALSDLGLAPIVLDPATAVAEPVEDDGALRVDTFGPYFRGVRFATMGLIRRLTDPADQAEAAAMSAMAASFLDSWKQRRSATSERG
ncbi:MAG: peroxiredoxin family protein [Streptosporangiaceae bacterium]